MPWSAQKLAQVRGVDLRRSRQCRQQSSRAHPSVRAPYQPDPPGSSPVVGNRVSRNSRCTSSPTARPADLTTTSPSCVNHWRSSGLTTTTDTCSRHTRAIR